MHIKFHQWAGEVARAARQYEAAVLPHAAHVQPPVEHAEQHVQGHEAQARILEHEHVHATAQAQHAVPCAHPENGDEDHPQS